MDRNVSWLSNEKKNDPSLSARRAWIEIYVAEFDNGDKMVALRKESVDRNAAWTGVLRDMHHVALRKESVDRNF